MQQSILEKGLSLMAHLTTAIAFGTAIFGLVFPERAANYVSTFLDEIEAARGTLEAVETNTASTAAATGSLADRMADRPRFTAVSRRMSGFGDTQPTRFQMTLENLTDRPVTDFVYILTTEDQGRSSNFLPHVIPPFERYFDAADGTPTMLCYAYAWDGVYVSETRVLTVSPVPQIDEMGNAATFAVNHTDYRFVVETEADAFTCADQVFTRSALAARKAEIDAGQ